MSLLQDLQREAHGQYQNVTPAFAYVFQHDAQKGLRIEAPDIALEYSNNVPLGRDPRGLLYYHGLPDLDPTLDMRYDVEVKRHTECGATKEEVLVIGFWTNDDKPDAKPYAIFLAGIPARAWGQIQGGKAVGGKWKPLDLLQVTCLAETRVVTLNMAPLNKRFEFDIPADQVEGSAIRCHGSVIARDVAQLTGTNLYVDYTNTRILIFSKQGDLHPIAVFSPFELPNDQPLADKSFQVNNGRFT